MMRFRKTLTFFDDYYDMVSDRVRMEAYRKAIFEVVKEGDVVVDLGAGLGILSFFALQAGAEKVYAIEKMDSIELARGVAALNGFSGRIVFIKDNSKHVQLPEKADLLLSETLGSFALEENTLEFTIDARRRLLKEGGRMIPQRLQLWLVPVELSSAYKKMCFWDDVWGINFSPAKEEIVRKMMVEDITPRNFLSTPKVYKEINLPTEKTAYVGGRMVFESFRPGTIHGFGGWFKVWLTPNISFDTSPTSPATHWRQAFLPLKRPVVLRRGDRVAIDLRISPGSQEGDNATLSYDVMTIPGEGQGDKVGRNEPCPCGSGRKYKKCCGR